MQVFYVNIGGGEPTIRPDFWHLLEYAVDHQVGVKFSTNGVRHHPGAGARSWRPAPTTSTCRSRSTARPPRSTTTCAARAPTTWRSPRCRTCRTPGSRTPRSRVVCTRQNIGQLDEFKALADQFGATLRLTRLRPSGRGADVWDELHPLPEQQRVLYDWLMAHGEDVLTGDSFFHLAAFGETPARAQPVRRRPRGLPDRPGRRRLRLPVRDPRQLPGRQPARRRRLPAGLADSELFAGAALAADRRRLRVVRSSSTPAAAAAWPRSSSPACRSTAPTPSACRGTARPALAGDRVVPAASQDHSKARPDPQPAGDAPAAHPPAGPAPAPRARSPASTPDPADGSMP